ncbi:hypothetical protein ACHHV8_20180 [Paenibacillus sp. TAB 01]|uniref:hypothetical protein n=1 Tax=Paenibacillus sp. TAB 01 TaxID=3368988 RepID=UPI00375294BB
MQYKSTLTGDMEVKQEPAGEEPEESSLPPRHAVHRSEREKRLRIFYGTLLWLFILLVVGLLIWGWRRVRLEL